MMVDEVFGDAWSGYWGVLFFNCHLSLSLQTRPPYSRKN